MAASFPLPGKIADGDLGLDVDRNPQGFGGGVGFPVEGMDIGIVASVSLIFFNGLVFCACPQAIAQTIELIT
jgi:hypothetical protein